MENMSNLVKIQTIVSYIAVMMRMGEHLIPAPSQREYQLGADEPARPCDQDPISHR